MSVTEPEQAVAAPEPPERVMVDVVAEFGDLPMSLTPADAEALTQKLKHAPDWLAFASEDGGSEFFNLRKVSRVKVAPSKGGPL